MVSPQPPSTTESSAPQIGKQPCPTPLDRVRGLLGTLLRMTTIDGRIFLGTFAGTDKLLNIILVNAEEYRIPQGPEDLEEEGRYVGMVLLPWKMVQKVEARAAGVDSDQDGEPEDGAYM